MYAPGLGAEQINRAYKVLSSTHQVQIGICLLSLNHDYDRDLTLMLQGGQVNIKATEGSTRSAQVQLYDPYRLSGLDSTNPMSGANYYNKMIHIRYRFWAQGSTEVFDVPIFTGPISEVKRDGSMLDISCVGKEVLAKHAFWNPLSLPQGALKTQVMWHIINQRSGETRASFAASGAKTGSVYSYGRDNIVWDEVKKIAQSMGWRIFYNGDGTLVCRPDSYNLVWIYTDGAGGSLLSEPQISYNDEEAINTVLVLGNIPSGKNATQATGLATLPNGHPLNQNAISRGGIPRILLQTIDRSDLKTVSECKAVANATLQQASMQQLSVSFDALVNPILEEGDYVRATVQGKLSVDFQLNEVSIPLVGAISSVGEIKNLSLYTGSRNNIVSGKRVKVPKKKKTKKKKTTKKAEKKAKKK